jgi:putative two-component system response regulator
MYLLIARRISLYNVSDTVIDSLVQNGDTGFISVDDEFRYLGSNGTARRMIPALSTLEIDGPLPDDLQKMLQTWLETPYADVYRTGEGEDERIYLVETGDLVSGGRKYGYQFFIRDDTQNQKYITLVNHYNVQLETEVKEKTKHILEMQDDLVLGMATMVESRDNSTGGHIRRTSKGVRMLVSEMTLDPGFSENLIKAAPMHDIGKIAVDDEILRKPGRFTPEEYEQMKKHSPEGARILREILVDFDDEDFKRIAVNVAHYHHERWDGRGYPDGLKGEEIPLEARIMAVADVYDALVSKRVYKDKMSFEDADRIIREGMGTQFDPELLDVYLRARPQLEDYYIHTDC